MIILKDKIVSTFQKLINIHFIALFIFINFAFIYFKNDK